jgi:3-deoxy-D-manno-octulosonic-acid transferase
VLLMELEIWPNFLQAAARRGIPVAVINGRISERTFRGYRLVRGLLPQLELIDTYCVQDNIYRQRLLDLGVQPDHVHVTGNMKYDSVVMGGHEDARAALRRWLAPDDRLVVVAGSTHASEEEWLLAACRAVAASTPLRLVLVPRHPERASALVETLGAAGAELVRWSEVADRPAPLADQAVVLVDTIGHLQRFYAACDLAFVGGSLVPHGGQNMLEPAAQGRAVLFGTHTSNFRTDVELLMRADAAVQVRDRQDLTDRLRELAHSPERRRQLGDNAKRVILANQGATERTLHLTRVLLGAG